MSVSTPLKTFVGLLVCFLAIFAAIAGPGEASAVPNPASGSDTGGTSVTVAGIRFDQVSAGKYFSLGLTSEGTVYSWGENGYGQLGDGTLVPSSVPVQVRDVSGTGYLSGVTAISAGLFHSLALTSSGLYSWGLNFSGELGDGTTVDRNLPVQVRDASGIGYLSGVTAISAGGGYHSLAVTPSGVFSWGDNGSGQLGNGSYVSSPFPAKVRDVSGLGFLTGATEVSAGSLHSIAVTPSGVYSWGYNADGELGNGMCCGDNSLPVQVRDVSGSGFLSGVTSVSAGGFHSLAVTPSGVFSWGLNNYGQLGDGTLVPSSVPVQVRDVSGSGSLSGVTSVSAGRAHSVAVTSAGVFSWGSNSYGQLGDGTLVPSSVPVQVRDVSGSGSLSGVSSVSAGGVHSLALISSGVYSWGNNSSGQLGNGAMVYATNIPVLGPNFQPNIVQFGSTSGTALSATNNIWTVTTPAHSAGVVTITGVANLFGGTTAATPATVSFNAGNFTYQVPAQMPAPAPSSSSSSSASPSSSSSMPHSSAPAPSSVDLANTGYTLNYAGIVAATGLVIAGAVLRMVLRRISTLRGLSSSSSD